MSRFSTRVHGSLCVQAVRAALIGLSAQGDSDWLLGQTARTNRSAGTASDRGARLDRSLLSGVNESGSYLPKVLLPSGAAGRPV